FVPVIFVYHVPTCWHFLTFYSGLLIACTISSGGWIIVMELYPGFALYRGLYEFSQYAFSGDALGTDGMRWGDLSDSTNGMKEVLIIMFLEWLLVLFFAYYIDQVLSSGSRKSPLFFLKGFQKKSHSSFRKPSIQRQRSKVFVQIDKPDVNQEREKVEQLLLEPTINQAIVCDNMRKVYPGRDGNPEKLAVRGLSLALPQGECFGMLGPNGAGKTSFINMMIGLTKPTSGTAFVQGLDIRAHMDRIYTSMGVCPQHDLLWESLTGREHLLFYGRLKNLKGSALTQAVEESLKSVNLFHGGVADKHAGKYSGGMKRRLSVAISLIGDPRVVYMDEPSTGLDPASRNNLWNVVKRAKQDRAIILTTHSMEEAEVLCDRLGIFVDGSLQCIGNPKELKARYGGTYVFTMTTSMDHEKDVENLVQQLSPNANKIYHISGTQKFELPKDEVKIANVFQAVETAKRSFTVSAWGLADTTLEDVFIKVARGAQAFDTLS
ncbi:ABC transporter A family member 7, partial [Mucuna pruriens]